MSVRNRLVTGALSLLVGVGLSLSVTPSSKAETPPLPPQPYQGTWGVDYMNFEDTLKMSHGLSLKVTAPEDAPGHYPTKTTVCNAGQTTRKVGFDNWATTGPKDGETWFIDPALEEPYHSGWPITPLEIAPGRCVTKFITAAREPNIVHFIHPVTGKRYDIMHATEWDGIPTVNWPRSHGSTGQYGDMTSDAFADVLAVNSAGAWQTYSSVHRPGLSAAGVPTNPPPGCCIDMLMKIPDLDRNGMSDYLWRGQSSGSLVVQPVMGTNRFGQQRIVGTGWGGISLLAVTEDANKDGHPELMARAADGRLIRYTLNRSGAITGASVIGTGWNGISKLFSIGDASGDGIPDLIAVAEDGRLLRYNLTKQANIGSVNVIGHGWASMGAVATPGDLNGNGTHDIVSIRSDGKLFFYNHRGGGKFDSARQIGTGWSGMKLIA